MPDFLRTALPFAALATIVVAAVVAGAQYWPAG